jgi:hypothetical protein
MMKKLLVILIALPMIGFGQNVNIPDADFKSYLVGNTAINTNGDSEIQVSEATNFSDTIDINGYYINDLTGIEAFTALEELVCHSQGFTSLDVSQNLALTYLNCGGGLQLTSLDVSQNLALTYLRCEDSQLTTLDVSNNTALTYLHCDYNQLTSLDVSNNLALTILNCEENQLTSLDVSQNLALTLFSCSGNQLTSLDVSQNLALSLLHCYNNQLTSLDVRNGNNINFIEFYSFNNPNLTCINVDDTAWSATNWTFANNNIDTQHYFSTNCSATGIQEHTTNKELLKVTDLLGRETKGTNRPLFYIYNDGTVEKRIVIE